MTERLAELQRRIGNLDELLEIISAMRSMAGVRRQQALTSLPGIDKYAKVVDQALFEAVALADLSRETGASLAASPQAFVAFCAEHSFVGAFNDHILDQAMERMRPNDQLLVIGSRGATLAEEKGQHVDWFSPMASHVAGVIEVARTVADEIYRRVADGVCVGVGLLYAESLEGLRWQPAHQVLLPFDFSGHRINQHVASAPFHHLKPDVLLERLVDEFVFGELMRASMQSFASENSARLVAMEAARDNVERKIGELRRHLLRRRQEETTEEILDVITGAKAAREAIG